MRTIPLRNNHGEVVAEALVDDEDFALVNQWRWCVGTKGYAIRRAHPGGTVRMARFIMGLNRGDSRQVDHINRDKLDNRRENLRIVTQAENRQNLNAYRGSTSRLRGVYLHSNGMWRANVRLNGVLHYLGQFAREEDAGAAAAAFRAKHMPYSQEAAECAA